MELRRDNIREQKSVSVAEAAGALGVTSEVAIQLITKEIDRLRSNGQQVDVAEHTRRMLLRVQ